MTTTRRWRGSIGDESISRTEIILTQRVTVDKVHTELKIISPPDAVREEHGKLEWESEAVTDGLPSTLTAEREKLLDDAEEALYDVIGCWLTYHHAVNAVNDAPETIDARGRYIQLSSEV